METPNQETQPVEQAEPIRCPKCDGTDFVFSQIAFEEQDYDTTSEDGWGGFDRFTEGQLEYAAFCDTCDADHARNLSQLFIAAGFRLVHDFHLEQRDQAKAGASLVSMPPTHWKGLNGLCRRGEAYVSGSADGKHVSVGIYRKVDPKRDRMPDLTIDGTTDEVIRFFADVLSQLLHERARARR